MREAYFVSNVKLTNLHKYVIIKGRVICGNKTNYFRFFV